jgi:hypothetical protein
MLTFFSFNCYKWGKLHITNKKIIGKNFSFFIFFLWFFPLLVTNHHCSQDNKQTHEEKKNKTLIYSFNKIKGLDNSGFKGFLPKYVNSSITMEELGKIIMDLLSKKGIDVLSLEIKQSLEMEDVLLLEIIIGNEASEFFSNVLWDSTLKVFQDKIEETKKQDSLFKFITKNIIYSKEKKEAVILLSDILLKQGGIDYINVQGKAKNGQLKFFNYHGDLQIPKIKNINVFFVKYKNGQVIYSNKVPDGLDIEKIKELLMMQEEEGINLLLSMVLDLPFSKVFTRNPKPLEHYILGKGYNNAQLLEMKFIAQGQYLSGFIYILVGDKLSLKNITFSIEGGGYSKLLGKLSAKERKFRENKKILQEHYIPPEIVAICRKEIKIPHEIRKNIKEVMVDHGHQRKLFYTINFEIVTGKPTKYLENIMFVNNLQLKNPLLFCKSQIGENISEKQLNKDKEKLSEITGEKVTVDLVRGSIPGHKVVIIKMADDFEFQKVLTQMIPSFSLNPWAINFSKTIKFSALLSNVVFPIELNWEIKKKHSNYLQSLVANKINQSSGFYSLDGKLKVELLNPILELISKKPMNDIFMSFSTGLCILPFQALQRPFYWFNQQKAVGNDPIIQSFTADWLLGSLYRQQSFLISHYFNLYYTYNFLAKSVILLLLMGKKMPKNSGLQYIYNINFSKEEVFNSRDYLSVELALRDRIKINIFTNPSLETNISYKSQIAHYFFFDQKIKIVKEFSPLLGDKDQEKGINIEKFKVIGIKNYFLQEVQYSSAFSAIGEIYGKIYKFNIFIGKEVQCFLGVFFNILIGENIENSNFEKRITTGILLSFNTEFGMLKLHFSHMLMGKTYFDQLQKLDFDIRGGNYKLTGKRKYWKEERASLIITDK